MGRLSKIFGKDSEPQIADESAALAEEVPIMHTPVAISILTPHLGKWICT